MKTAHPNRRLLLSRVGGFVGCALAAPLLLPGCASGPPPTATAESAFGIRVAGLHLSAHGYILDLRYRVLDPDKAAPLLNAKSKVFLLDEAHDAMLGVPQSPIVGGMRQTSRNRVIYTDRDYFILFVNPGRAVRSGDTLKLAVDGVRIAQLLVQ
jgi:hypothetical protein